MKKKKSIRKLKIFRPASAALLAGALIMGSCLSAYADAGTADLDFDRAGSISVSLSSGEDGTHASDGVLTLYRVADLYLDDGNMAYACADEFSGSGIFSKNAGRARMAEELAACVEENGLTGTDEYVGVDGNVTFSELSLGMYLVMQTTRSTGYYAVDPFLVTVPEDMDGVWVYDVDAGPKLEIKTTSNETTSGETAPNETTADETTPGESISGKPESEQTISAESVSGGAVLEEPASGKPAAISKLPQTGQLMWPVPVMMAAGLLLCCIGACMKRRAKTENRR